MAGVGQVFIGSALAFGFFLAACSGDGDSAPLGYGRSGVDHARHMSVCDDPVLLAADTASCGAVRVTGASDRQAGVLLAQLLDLQPGWCYVRGATYLVSTDDPKALDVDAFARRWAGESVSRSCY